MVFLRFLLLLIPIVSCLVIDCKFEHGNWWVIGAVYVCKLNSDPSILSYGTDVIGANGNHQQFMNHQSVTAFESDPAHTINYMPRGLSKVFPNLTAIYINNGRIKEIHQDDLKEFTKLKYLSFYSNDIKILEEDLFKFNPDLMLVGFHGDKINQVHPNVFDNLNQLQWLRMNNNECVTGEEKTKTAVLELIKKVKKQCGPNYLLTDLHNKINQYDQKFAVIDVQTNKIENFESTINQNNQIVAELKQESGEKSTKIKTLELIVNQNTKNIQELKQQNVQILENIEKQIFELKVDANNNLRQLYALINRLINRNDQNN